MSNHCFILKTFISIINIAHKTTIILTPNLGINIKPPTSVPTKPPKVDKEYITPVIFWFCLFIDSKFIIWGGIVPSITSVGNNKTSDAIIGAIFIGNKDDVITHTNSLTIFITSIAITMRLSILWTLFSSFVITPPI